jgi:hypothetical protein
MYNIHDIIYPKNMFVPIRFVSSEVYNHRLLPIHYHLDHPADIQLMMIEGFLQKFEVVFGNDKIQQCLLRHTK